MLMGVSEIQEGFALETFAESKLAWLSEVLKVLFDSLEF